mmetsp:Transcript_7622/g.11642  ORF Transcript_7622/g.11642 Transcript_7622/m.11642 type:complete len:916 (-) Transcript_7622:113-2860(-)|eukprot:CAMPEP_0178917676 /NCGR_PEP_ID=MMETSP0786-20121207/13384_1 /TAXON_ID=186022 /ORGANISM="Thalassionema frauenfeldii, Strain CCMP 1798" /LENGTH=915 /DNA_ID=CAMNT_0020591263 /DNA_START=154 /DNA_END=2901 /DNA_ORIENTATION=+
MADSKDPEPSGVVKSRSVNDFDDASSLRDALKDSGKRSSFVVNGREFPRALIGSSLGVPREDDDMSECSKIFEPDKEQDWALTNYKSELSEPQTLDQELRRLQVLKSYLILDSEREDSFERLTGLAARMFHVPIALVSLVDLGRQWFMSNRGLGDTRETPRKFAFCAHTIISKEDLLIVKDASKDSRFRDNPLVTGPPYIRFYGGAPLLCPEGYKLGTLCIIDTKVRTEDFSLEDKQNLRELASLVVDAMVQRRRERMRFLEDRSQIIATTAHDLLTPLSGVQMNLSLLMEDREFIEKITMSERDLIETASSCSDVMQRICHQAIEIFHGDDNQHGVTKSKSQSGSDSRTIVVAELVKNLKMVMEPYPKKVPLFISVDKLVPPQFVSDDLKIFRSTVNYLTNALQKTESGNVHLKIFVGNKKNKPRLVFECEDTGPGVPMETYKHLFRPFRKTPHEENCVRVNETGVVDSSPVCNPNTKHDGLGLYSVANQISSIGGEYGFRPRDSASVQRTEASKVDGAIFWFSIPLVVPDDDAAKAGSASDAACSTSKRGIPDESINCRKIRAISEVEVDNEDLSEEIMVTDEISRVDLHRQGKANLQQIDGAGKRVRHALIIDDSVVIRKSMDKALTKHGFRVTQAVNGLEGLKQLQQQVFDIVLCDYLMPVMDGLDCVQQYRDWEEAHRPWFQQYIVGISAHASTSDVEKGKKAGMSEFRSKPITMKHLKELIASPDIGDVSKKLDSILTMQDGENDDVEMVYRNEFSHPQQAITPIESSDNGPSCLIAEPPSNSVMKEAVENLGWCAVQVHDGEDALRLLQMRNWNAVFIENEIARLSGTGCIARFRQWEEENRVARQNNIFLLSTDFVPSPTESVSAVYPKGFDGALGKPILMKDLKKMLQYAAHNIEDSANSQDIVTR